MSLDTDSANRSQSMVATIEVPISPGELLDRISILEIKAARIVDPHLRSRAAQRLIAHREIAQRALAGTDLSSFLTGLSNVNGRLWDIENRLRSLDAEQHFSTEFVELAQQVYRLNDKRAHIKNEVDQLFGAIGEVKEYRS